MADQRPVKTMPEMSEKTEFEDADLVMAYDDALQVEQKSTFGTLKEQIATKGPVVKSVASIADLPPVVIGNKISVTGYHPDTTVGGMDQGVGKSARHDGVINFDPNRTFPTPAEWANGSSDPAVINWFDDTQPATACWERVDSDKTIYDAGAVADDVNFDNLPVIRQIAKVKYYCKAGKGIFYTSSVDGLSGVGGGDLRLSGAGELETEFYLLDGNNNHLFSAGAGEILYLDNLTLNQNRDNQTGGHGIRLGGVNAFIAHNLTIKNCAAYAIGCQAGSNKGMFVNELTVDNTGFDGIDIKDYNLDNDIFYISNYKFSNIGTEATSGCALDIRGGVVAVNVSGTLSANNVAGNTMAYRLRDVSVQGRAGFGSINNLHVEGDGTGFTYAFQLQTSARNWTVNNVTTKGIQSTMLTGVDVVGGVISNVASSECHGDSSLSGKNIRLNNVHIEVTAAAGRAIDIESGSSNIMLSSVHTEGDGVGVNGNIRINGNDHCLSDVTLTNGSVQNFGTATIQENVRII